MSSKPRSEPAIPILPNGNGTTAQCWSCGDMRAAQFCHSCGKLQPAVPTDYFSFFGLPRHLNLDVDALEREMYAFSRHLHPDLYVRSTPQEQAWSLELSSKLNDAYRTLRDPIARTEYLLRLEGVKSGEQSKEATERARTSGTAKKQLVPPDLLEEVFEISMQLEELRANRTLGEEDGRLVEEVRGARDRMEEKLKQVSAQLRACWDAWDELAARAPSVSPDERRATCQKMLEVLNRRKYIANLLREISAALE
jgi:molecular chaperone HscB